MHQTVPSPGVGSLAEYLGSNADGWKTPMGLNIVYCVNGIALEAHPQGPVLYAVITMEPAFSAYAGMIWQTSQSFA
jgi:hypothetical protein